MLAALLVDVTSVCVEVPQRESARRPAQRRIPRLSRQEVEHDLITCECACEYNCFNKIKMLPDAVKVMQQSRTTLVQAGHRGSTRLLFQMLKARRVRNIGANCSKTFSIHFHIQGVAVCAIAWFLYHDLSERDSRVRRVLASIRRGDENWVVSTGSARSGPDDFAGQAARLWMKEYVVDYCEQIPNRCLFRVEPVHIGDLHDTYVNVQRLLAVSYHKYSHN